MSVSICIFVYLYICVFVSASVCVCTFVSVSASACMSVSLSVCVSGVKEGDSMAPSGTSETHRPGLGTGHGLDGDSL